MKKKALVPFLFAMVITLTNACYYDTETSLYPYSICVTGNVGFAQDIMPVLQRSCFSCHDKINAPLNGNITLESHADVLKSVENGTLLGSVRHDAGYMPMPQNAQQIHACEIKKMEAWIANGALDN